MHDRMMDQTAGDKIIPYKPVVVWIHWIMALLIFIQLWLGFTFGDLPRESAERASRFEWHRTVGVTILLLATIRLIVRWMNPPPLYPSSVVKWQRVGAQLVEWSLYFCMFALPLTGLMHVSKGGPTTQLEWGLSVPTIPLPELGEIHGLLAAILVLLLIGHIGAALKHAFDKDGVIDRMLPFLAKKN